jgi:hypothetical protein
MNRLFSVVLLIFVLSTLVNCTNDRNVDQPGDDSNPDSEDGDSAGGDLEADSYSDGDSDDDGDAFPDSENEHVFCRKTSQGRDTDFDGVADKGCEMREYDDRGLLLNVKWDQDCDGNAEQVDACGVEADRSVCQYSANLDNFDPQPCRADIYLPGDRVVLHCNVPDCDGKLINCDYTRFENFNDPFGDVFSGRDANGDMVFDQCDYRIHSEPDPKTGVVTRTYFTDLGCDGGQDEVCFTEGLLSNEETVFSSSDMECDGVPDDWCMDSTFDRDGRLLSTNSDYDCDGMPDNACRIYSYDSAGRVTAYSFDSHCAGTLFAHVTRKYDADGRLLREQAEADIHPDYKRPIGYVYPFARDYLPHDLEDFDLCYDGCFTRQYDAQNAHYVADCDYDCDGSLDKTQIFRRGSHGKIVYVSQHNFGGNAEQPDKCTHVTYDANGRLTAYYLDTTCDGKADQYCHSDISYSAAGQVTGYKWSLDCSEDFACHTTTYDIHGEKLSEKTDYLCDGIVNENKPDSRWGYWESHLIYTYVCFVEAQGQIGVDLLKP